jgi:CRP-like cAMP-binding protein
LWYVLSQDDCRWYNLAIILDEPNTGDALAIQVDFLKSMPYFAGLSQGGIEALGRYVFEKKAQRGDILVFEGEPCEDLFFVAEGVVKVFKTSADGKEQIFSIIRPGESFNDVPVLNEGVNLFSAEAMGPALLRGIKKKDMRAIIRENPQVAINVVQVLSRRVQDLVSLVEDLSFRHVTSRVAKMLMGYIGSGPDERPRLTQQEMAAIIGTAREMVGRSLKTLESTGAIRIERARIVIADRKELARQAGVE